ncbi:M56 family metallopeptidase [Streptomyces yaizuensis]|uniref:M56 family metallopeptidase n=1 Tax=Streptomyces yaizuensis TaxID=2989713 RepID=A0ABQ5NZ10_9ACTN|nr:M56 family metallopeptidase [Streptomyces sp. YSPA8]GLF95393.1 M56 family metallopeptidase [Streptomyces sp. YSPA8]
MTDTALKLGGYALLVGVAAPWALVRARWAHRAPAAALLAWQTLIVSFVVAVALAVPRPAAARAHLPEGLVALLGACGFLPAGRAPAAAPTPAETLLLAVPALVVLVPLAVFARTAWRARRHRADHARLLDLIGTESERYGATVVDHAVPAVYCLPGRARRIVVTRGALECLTEAGLRAVLAHERSHLRGRHHLLLAATAAFARVLPRLPLARHAREQTALLVEMAADDRALREHSREELATAMYEMAAGRAPRAALGAAGPDGSGALIRMCRMLTPGARPHRALWPAVLTGAAGAPLLPVLLACHTF